MLSNFIGRLQEIFVEELPEPAAGFVKLESLQEFIGTHVLSRIN
jgi:hypothetical protein